MSGSNRSFGVVWLLVIAFWLSVLSPSLTAQTTTTGSLAGTVTDASGAVVPNATVTVTSADTGQVRTAMSSENGSYNIGLLPPGMYRVRFEAAGFRATEIPSVTIVVTETETLNHAMEVGTQAEEVTVQGQVETVQTSNATVGTVVNSQQLTGLPLTTRNYTNLLGLSAGANVGVFNASTLGKGTQNIAVNGASTGQNNFMMDGAPIMSVGGSGSAIDSGAYAGIGIANPDAIQEFKIQTSQFDAGYGRTPGSNVNVVTKSGTNQWHGDAFEFFRNTVLNANDFFRKISPPSFVNGTSVPNNGRAALDSNQFGGVFGGPVKKDKLFFFISYQESRQKNGIASAGASAPILPPIPTGDRSNTAAFRAALGAIFCPTGTAGGKTSTGGVQVACNGSNINPVAINIMQLKNPDGSYYIPSSGTAGYQNTTFSNPAIFKDHQAIGNFDYVINSKNTFSGRYFYERDPTIAPFECGNTGTTVTPTPGNCVPYTSQQSAFTNEYGVARLTTILTNNLVNEAHLALQRSTTNNQNTVPFTNDQVGITDIVPSINQLDQIAISGSASITAGTSEFSYSHLEITSWEALDQLSWSHGKHTIRTGFEYERDRINWNPRGLSLGVETFQSFQDFLIGLPGCSSAQILSGCSAASPFPGTNGTASSNISNTGTAAAVGGPNGIVHAFRMGSADAFIQDDYKMSSRLTVNLGVRWEYNGYNTEKYGNNTNIWPSLILAVPVPTSPTLAGWVVPSNYNPAINPAPPVGGLFQSNHKVTEQNDPPIDNFAPRVGLAWQPLASNRLVFRGGFGFFYDRPNLTSYASGALQGEPYGTTIDQAGSANYFSSEAVPYGTQTGGWTPRLVNFTTGSSTNISQVLLQQVIHAPLIYEWNLNAQYEFLPTWVLELGYVGSHGIHQTSGSRQINEAQLVGNPLGTNTIDAPAIDAGLVPTNTVANASLRVPYLGFAPGGMLTQTFQGDEKFNSLQVTVRKQMSHGLTLQSAYTWSKSLTDFGSSFNSNDPNNFKQQYGPNPLYHPQRLAVSYDWNLPFGNPEGLKGKLVNGWSFSGVTVAQDGTPLTLTDTRGGSIFGFGPGAPVTSRAQFAPGMSAANVASPGGVEARLGGSVRGGPGWFNKAAFGTTPVIGNGTGYGNSGIGIILGPGQFNWDMSLVKDTKVGGLREDATLQFRTEFFNTFNHAQFNNPTVVDVSKSTLGNIVTTSVSPRVIQFALKYSF